MTKQKKKTKTTTRQLTLRELNMIDALPMHGWSVIKAGLATGYSENYANTMLLTRAKNDVTLSRAIERKRQQTAKKLEKDAGWTLERWQQQQAEILHLAIKKGDIAGANTAMRQLGQHIGAFEADNSQRRSNVAMLIM